jgi:hypothetical protein
MSRIGTIGVALFCVAAGASHASHASLITLPAVTVTSVSHDHPSGGGVVDSASGAAATPPNQGSYSQPAFTETFTGKDTVTMRIVAPDGQKFVLAPRPGSVSASLDVLADWVDTPNFKGFAGVFAVNASLKFVRPDGSTMTTPPGPAGDRLISPTAARLGGSFTVQAFAPIEFVELDVMNTFNSSIATPVAAHYDPVFFKMGSSGGSLSSGADFTVLSLQPVPEPAGAMIVGFVGGLTLVRQRDRRASAG